MKNILGQILVQSKDLSLRAQQPLTKGNTFKFSVYQDNFLLYLYF